MARRLPWADGPPRATSSTLTRAPPRAAHNSEAANTDTPRKANDHVRDTTPSPATTPPCTPQRRKRSRSLSPSASSPLPQPPSVSKLRPGYSADDVYIMVEDEFYTVAQSYTAHLHMAEYKRLMKKAKDGQAKQLPTLSPSMSRTTKMGLQRKHLGENQWHALDDLGMGGKTADNDEDQANGGVRSSSYSLWAGTSLAGLMDKGKATKRSLVGLEALQSSTRAARGFDRCKTMPPETRQRPTTATHQIGREEDNEKLEIPARRTTKSSLSKPTDTVLSNDKIRPVDIKRSKPDPKTSRAVSSSRQPSSPPTKSTTNGRFRSRLDDLATFEDSFELPMPKSDQSRATMKIEQSPTKSLDDRKKDRKARLDEVPMFMF